MVLNCTMYITSSVKAVRVLYYEENTVCSRFGLMTQKREIIHATMHEVNHVAWFFNYFDYYILLKNNAKFIGKTIDKI